VAAVLPSGVERIRRLRSLVRSRPRLFDAALAGVALVLSVLGQGLAPDVALRAPAPALLVTAVSCAALAWRRRQPLVVLAVAAAGVGVLLVIGDAGRPFVFALNVALYTVAREGTRRRATLLALSCATVLTVTSVAAAGRGVFWENPQTLLVVWPALATAVGIVRRIQWQESLAAEARARREEQARVEDTRRQVADERLRIARDLHDIVAHQIALIGVQAGVAAQLLRVAPDGADTALGHVRTASREVLTELGAMLNVLRRPDDDAPREPTPGLARTPVLFQSFIDAGLPIRLTVSGRPQRLASAVDLTAYRVLQEALTNVQKHGDGSVADVAMSWSASILQIDVRNEFTEPDHRGVGRPPDGDGTVGGSGLGLLGMTERAQGVGGSLSVRRAPAGVFTVRALLPAVADRPRETDAVTATGPKVESGAPDATRVGAS